jgi:hypothetical protein
MAPATHIIGKQNIRLRYNGAKDKLALRQAISRVCSDELPVRLNALLDKYDRKDEVLRLDKIQVDVQLDDNGDLEERLAKAIIEQVEAALLQKMELYRDEPVSIDKSFARALRFYLGQGYLPWWHAGKDAAAFRELLQDHWDSPALKNTVSLILPILRNGDARRRLLSLLNDDQLEALVLATGVWSEGEWKEWQTAIAALKHAADRKISEDVFSKLVRQAILNVVSATADPGHATAQLATELMVRLQQQGIAFENEMLASIMPSVIQDAFRAPLDAERDKDTAPVITKMGQAHPEIKNELEKRSSIQKEEKSPAEGDSIFISNAGLVLIAPYLPTLFRHVNLLEDGKPVDIARAISLLQYLVYEEAAFEEFETVLDKILCGLPLNESIPERHTLTVEEKEQSEGLLQSVIEHWSILKNTSPTGLRQSFLQREGKLVFKGNQWELTVQKKSFDILLDYLPWNISMIKLPWMPYLLNVKWN